MRSYNEIIKEVKNPSEKKIDITKVISEQTKFPIHVVKRGIMQGQLTINSKPVYLFEIILRQGSIIKFQNTTINLARFINKNEFDVYIEFVLSELKDENIVSIKPSSKKPFCSYAIAYFANNSLEQVVESGSVYLDSTVSELENIYKENFKESGENRTPKRKELIELLVKQRTECVSELSGLIANLTSGIFSNSLYKFLQEYTKIINKNAFQTLLAPLLSNRLFTRLAIDALIKPITIARSLQEADEKYNHFTINQTLYSSYLAQINNKNGLHLNTYKIIGSYLYELFKKECDTAEVKSANINISSTARKYNFSNPDRPEYDIFLYVQNTGEGLARDTTIISLSNTFQFAPFTIGILKPDELREISISAKITYPIEAPSLNIKCTWLDVGNAQKEKSLKIDFGIQNLDIPWEELERAKPYTIQEIDNREKLYGRDEILQELEHNILSNNIESYKIWGQKRVGKSSIVKTLKSLFVENENIIVVWRSIAGLKNTDPILTLNTLGESICSEIFEEISVKINNSGIKQLLRTVPVPEFKGSFYPLESYIKSLKRIEGSLRFIFIIDEFDRINEEFFTPGTLGDTFSLNIGKGLNSLNYVGFILVGSENMHLLNRQEINYNSFQNREVDTFNKETEFDSFKKIITGPVHPHITYSDDAVSRIFDATNGNPYFANLICSHIFSICSKLKDNEVDIHTANKAIRLIVETSHKAHFEHFWADGITDESSVKKEIKSDIRRRILVSYSFCFFQTKSFPERADIVRNFKKTIEYEIEAYEIENTITEFYNRKIFFDEKNSIRIRPLIFEEWLCGPGRTLMIEGVSDLEALQREKQLEAEHKLKQEELVRISESLKFQGDKLKASELAKYFNQFGGPFEQRRIFNLIDKITFISKDEIIEFIKREQRNIFRKSELTLKTNAKSPYREDVEFYSFPDTLIENQEIFQTFKTLTHIRKTKTLKDIRLNKDAWKNSNADDIIVFESVIDDFSSIQDDLLKLFDEKLKADNIPIKLITLIITSKAKADLIKFMSTHLNFKLIHFKELEESAIKPFISTSQVFETNEETREVFAEVRKRYPDTSRESLNVLFETHCPGKTIPILWHSTNHFKPIFPNPNGVFLNESSQANDGEIYRDRVYQANKELIQAINPFLINHIKDKAKKASKDDWFLADYLPKTVMEKIFQKWSEEGTSKPKESYFDLIHYKEIIKKNKELMPLFQINEGGGDGLNWIDRVNELRRDPAHPEKPPPTLEQAEYFEKKKDEVLTRISTYKTQNS